MEGADPYRSPEGQLAAAPASGLELMAASKLRRFLNWLMDLAVIYGLLFMIMLGLYMAGQQVLVDRLANVSWWQDQLLTSACQWLYYTVMEGLFGFSIAKLITNTRVVDAQGLRITFGQAALRSGCRMIPFNAFSLLLSDDETRRGWHDILSRTHVVLRRRVAPLPVHFETASDSTTMSST